jgi:hypothetical protein
MEGDRQLISIWAIDLVYYELEGFGLKDTGTGIYYYYFAEL